MRISVVTPTYNKPDLLARTLTALEAQDLEPTTFDVVVVDDGSDNVRTAELLATHRPRHGFTVVRVEENRGRAAARNRGLERAEGELVVFLDDDMELVPGFLGAHADLHRRMNKVAGVGDVQNHPEITMAPIDRYMSTRGAQKIRDRGALPWKYFSTNNSSVRRDDLVAVGGFDENFRYYGFEDLELAYRLEQKREVTLRFVEGAKSLHIHPHTLDEVLDKKTLCGRSSLPYLFDKHPETRAALGYTRFDPPRAGDPLGLNLQRLFLRILLTRPVYTLVKPLALLPLGALTNRAIDFLVQYHYLEGLRAPRLP